MNREPAILTSRREFLTSSASGIGGVALAWLLARDGLLPAAEGSKSQAEPLRDPVRPLVPRPPHFEPRAKSCIFIFMAGGSSQLDLFDPKPRLQDLHGQRVPESLVENVRFAFINKDTTTLMASPRKFAPRGECGMELSDLLPHLGTVADELLLVRSMRTDPFNHHPGQLMMQCGGTAPNLPSMGAWLAYGLGSESQNLPAYVVLTAGARGNSAGTTIWRSGFLPSDYAGVYFRNEEEPVLDVADPPGLPRELQRRSLDALGRLNAMRLETVRDPDIASRISSYELAFRMQSAAPELIDLSGESARTLAMYGIGRKGRNLVKTGGLRAYEDFSRSCLLARRMVERGVRFVNIIHSSWDHHGNINNELPVNAEIADQPIAALIRDLKQRGLLDETLVVWGTEFGRTPLSEERYHDTGRDHHPFAFSMFLAGGGVRAGHVHGATDDIGWSIVKDPVHVHDLHATLLHRFGLDHLRLTYRHQGRDYRLTDVAGRVVHEWLV